MKPVAALTLAFVIGAFSLTAQDQPKRGRPGEPPPPPRDNPGAEQDRPPGPGGGWPGGPQPQMGPGGPATMIASDGFIFVFVGGTLYKVDPKEMKVVGELQVIKGPPPRIRKPDGDRPPEPDPKNR